MREIHRDAKKRGRCLPAIFAPLLLILAASVPCSAGDVTLTSDSLSYDPAERIVRAAGNVRLESPEGELFADRGRGVVNGKDFEMSGNVRGNFRKEGIEIHCRSIDLRSEGEKPARRKLRATGNVRLVRGEDRLLASNVSWELGGDHYRASGNVSANFSAYSIEADEAARDGEQFWAQGVRRYEDRVRKIVVKTSKARGVVRGKEVTELTAEGPVEVVMFDRNGKRTTVRGDKGVFSKERGSVVISGNARADQDGRTLTADSIVYHLDGGKIDALGRPSMVIEKTD